MFVCEACLAQYERVGLTVLRPRSYGPCEECRANAVCIDVPVEWVSKRKSR